MGHGGLLVFCNRARWAPLTVHDERRRTAVAAAFAVCAAHCGDAGGTTVSPAAISARGLPRAVVRAPQNASSGICAQVASLVLTTCVGTNLGQP